MRIVVNHLTRMQKGFICVAGVELATERHVRPMLQSQMRTRFLARYGGPFEIGEIVDLGWTKPIGEPPAVEDHLFHRSEARRAGDLGPDEFWQLLQRIARPTLREIFGDALGRQGPRSYGVAVGNGSASLGCYRPASLPRLFVQKRDAESHGRVRIELQAGDDQLDLGVTDIRLYGPDHYTPDPQTVDHINARLQAAASVILSVGLTRPFAGSDEREPCHWLQVNNLHFPDDPCWRLG